MLPLHGISTSISSHEFICLETSLEVGKETFMPPKTTQVTPLQFLKLQVSLFIESKLMLSSLKHRKLCHSVLIFVFRKSYSNQVQMLLIS